MPVVLITAAPLASEEATSAMLTNVNAAVAGGLGLRPQDVYSAVSVAAAARLGADEVAAWPVAVVYGSQRPAERTAAALEALRAVLVASWQCPADSVWAQWVVSA